MTNARQAFVRQCGVHRDLHGITAASSGSPTIVATLVVPSGLPPYARATSSLVLGLPGCAIVEVPMQTLITSTRTARIVLKPAVFGLSLWPAAAFARDVWFGQLGLDPYRRAIVDSGDWALWFLVFTLALTPARRLTGWHWLNLFRRMLGLFAFFYASVHTLVYVTFEPLAAVQLEGVGSAWVVVGDVIAQIGHEIADKPFIALGVIAAAALVPLAVTSSAAMIRRLGGRRWRRLHRLVFLAAGAGLLHHWWPLGGRLHADAFGLSLATVAIVRLAWWRRSARPLTT